MQNNFTTTKDKRESAKIKQEEMQPKEETLNKILQFAASCRVKTVPNDWNIITFLN